MMQGQCRNFDSQEVAHESMINFCEVERVPSAIDSFPGQKFELIIHKLQKDKEGHALGDNCYWISISAFSQSSKSFFMVEHCPNRFLK